MSARFLIAVLALATGLPLLCQQPKGSDVSSDAVIIRDLGIRYTPPAGMTDKTAETSQQARDRANSYTTKAPELLLDLSSGDQDDSPDWHQIWMFHFPRAQLANLSDWMAEAKVNGALAGPKAEPAGQPSSATFDGHSFLVSEFEQSEPPLNKHAKVYTTVCKTQLVSFVLVANSPEQITAMEGSLKSLSFSGRKAD